MKNRFLMPDMHVLCFMLLMIFSITACGSSNNSKCNGETLTGTFTISSTEELAALKGYSAVDGDILIYNNGNETLDFECLTCLEAVHGSLEIRRSNQIDLKELMSLKRVEGDLIIQSNPYLSSLGLDSILYVGGSLLVETNASLCADSLLSLRNRLQGNDGIGAAVSFFGSNNCDNDGEYFRDSDFLPVKILTDESVTLRLGRTGIESYSISLNGDAIFPVENHPLGQLMYGDEADYYDIEYLPKGENLLEINSDIFSQDNDDWLIEIDFAEYRRGSDNSKQKEGHSFVNSNWLQIHETLKLRLFRE